MHAGLMRRIRVAGAVVLALMLGACASVAPPPARLGLKLAPAALGAVDQRAAASESGAQRPHRRSGRRAAGRARRDRRGRPGVRPARAERCTMMARKLTSNGVT
jgi:hypothetical protein